MKKSLLLFSCAALAAMFVTLASPASAQKAGVAQAGSPKVDATTAKEIRESAGKKLAAQPPRNAKSSTAKTPTTKTPTKDPGLLQLPLSPRTGQPIHTGRLIVMFKESAGFRAPRTAGVELSSMSRSGVGDVSQVQSMLLQFGATIRQAINTDPVLLDELRARGLARSGRVSPDLASMMMVEGVAPSQLLSAGRAFLALPDVEWVEVEAKVALCGPQGGGCQVPPPTCADGPLIPWIACSACGPCGAPGEALPCVYPHPGTVDDQGNPVGNCLDTNTCALVNSFRLSCDTCWDEVCATLANLLGPSAFGGDGIYDTCLQTIQPGTTPPPGYPPPFPFDCDWDPIEESIVITNSPFDLHGLAGSANPDCCRAVCFTDVSCCTVAWDENCASIAIGLYNDCYSTPGLVISGGSPKNPSAQDPSPLFDPRMLQVPPPVTTPDSFALSLYTTAQKFPDPYAGPNPPPPTPPGTFAPFLNATGFRGGGLDVAGFRSLLNMYPGENGPQLPTIKVAVVEPSALVNHEDLISPITGLSKVTVEAGQTPLVINDASDPPPTFEGSFDTAPMHGTATLGIISAEENNFGITGIVPESEVWFFPTESFEEQGRLLTAMANAAIEMSNITAADPNPGNIMVLPIYTALGQPLNTAQAIAPIIASAINAGVTVVLAAGNASQAINPPIEGSQEAVIAGGVNPGFQFTTVPSDFRVYPGLNYCRAGSSNFSGTDPATVDVSGWGRGVATLGYGDLFCGANAGVSPNLAVAEYEQNRLRTYTATWGGTSAGAAQIAGVTAMMQALSKQVYEGLPLSSADIKGIFATPDSVYPQCGLEPGVGQIPFPAPGGPPGAFIGDLITDGESDIADVGGFPALRRIGSNILTGNFFTTNQCEFQLVTGTLLSGSQLSIREVDNKFVKAMTARPSAGGASSGFGPPLFYPTSKRVIDVQVVRSIPLNDPEDLTQVSVRVVGQTISAPSGFVMAFIYNYATNRWLVMPPYIGLITSGGAPITQFRLPACVFPSYVGIPTSTGVDIVTRVIVLPQGGLGSQTQIWLDQIEILYNSPLGDVGDACGGGGGG
jgi:hypothetical protein